MSISNNDNTIGINAESCKWHCVQAARAIAELNEVSSRELAPAIVCLQLFLTSRKTVMRFASVRTLNMISMTKPSAVQACNLDLEQLMSEPNRSIATYAITTLLKTGPELSIERLLKQISNFMSDIAGARASFSFRTPLSGASFGFQGLFFQGLFTLFRFYVFWVPGWG